jgi:hypothetical protein
MTRDPPVLLHDGDTLEVEIGGISVLAQHDRLQPLARLILNGCRAAPSATQTAKQRICDLRWRRREERWQGGTV